MTQEEVVADLEKGWLGIRGREPGSFDFGPEGVLGGVVGFAGIGAVNERGKGRGVLADEQCVEGHRLTRAIGGFANLEGASRQRAQIAIAGGVDEDRGPPGLAAGLGFGGDGGEAAAFAVGGGDAGMELEGDAGFDAEFFKEQLEALGLVTDALHAGAAADVAFRHASQEFLGEAGFVEVQEIAKESGCPDAAQATAPFKQADLRSRPGGGDRGGDSGWSGSADDDIGIGDEREIAGRFGEGSGGNRGFHLCSAQRGGRDQGTGEGGAEEVAAIVGVGGHRGMVWSGDTGVKDSGRIGDRWLDFPLPVEPFTPILPNGTSEPYHRGNRQVRRPPLYPWIPHPGDGHPRIDRGGGDPGRDPGGLRLP